MPFGYAFFGFMPFGFKAFFGVMLFDFMPYSYQAVLTQLNHQERLLFYHFRFL